MSNLEKIIITTILLIIASLLGIQIYYESRGCRYGHIEKQIKMPVGVVVGATESWGGVSVPVGNGKIVDEFVCDVYN